MKAHTVTGHNSVVLNKISHYTLFFMCNMLNNGVMLYHTDSVYILTSLLFTLKDFIII